MARIAKTDIEAAILESQFGPGRMLGARVYLEGRSGWLLEAIWELRQDWKGNCEQNTRRLNEMEISNGIEISEEIEGDGDSDLRCASGPADNLSSSGWMISTFIHPSIQWGLHFHSSNILILGMHALGWTYTLHYKDLELSLKHREQPSNVWRFILSLVC